MKQSHTITLPSGQTLAVDQLFNRDHAGNVLPQQILYIGNAPDIEKPDTHDIVGLIDAVRVFYDKRSGEVQMNDAHVIYCYREGEIKLVIGEKFQAGIASLALVSMDDVVFPRLSFSSLMILVSVMLNFDNFSNSSGAVFS